MRRGDFSGNSFVIRDPLTGVQFSGNRIPVERIDPAARRITDFFFPLPNQAQTSNGGFGTYRQILALSRARDRADVRIDHELNKSNSLFARFSWQNRDPDAFTFESTGGNGGGGLTNLGLLDRASKAMTFAVGWTRIWSDHMVNEFRGGYSADLRNRRSISLPVTSDRRLASKCPLWPRSRPGFRRSCSPRQTARRTSAISGRTRSAIWISLRFR